MTNKNRVVNPEALADKSLKGDALSHEEALSVLNWPDDGLLPLINAAFRVRRNYFGKTVKLNFLANIQSGLCAEDCHYCSQSKISEAPVDKYRLMSPADVVSAAEMAVKSKASRLCLVASMRGPSERDVQKVAEAVRDVKEKYPNLEICCCLGLLQEGQAKSLKDAGTFAYNHNLNTSERYYGDICKTHTFDDRVETVERARFEGLSTCSGALFGMGETQDDILDVAYRLREMNVESVPVNFLIPIKGTPLSHHQDLNPRACLKILCLFRFLCPKSVLRIAGGREVHLRSLQPLGLYVANSIFIGDYLTTKGQAAALDLEMIRDMGFVIQGESPLEEPVPALADRVAIVTRATRS